MKLLETFKNIWKIEDLRSKILTTILFILIYRFGSFIVLPGIDPSALTALKSQTSGGLLVAVDEGKASEFEALAGRQGMNLKPFGKLVSKKEVTV